MHFVCQRTTVNHFSDVILRNVVKLEQVADPISPVTTILKRCNKHVILSIYKIPEFNTPNEFLINIARKNGKLMKGGIPSIPIHYCLKNNICWAPKDINVAAKMVLQDWTGGKIPFYTEPPAVNPDVHVGASIVSQVVFVDISCDTFVFTLNLVCTWLWCEPSTSVGLLG